MEDNKKLTDDFLTDHSYIWLVSKAMVQYIGYSDMLEFVNRNYYIKANLTKNRMVDRVSGRMDMYQYPDDYTGFIYAFAKGLMLGVAIDEVNYDFDRNNLLGKYAAGRKFMYKEYSFGNTKDNFVQLNLYCQMYLEDASQEVYISILIVDMSALYHKSVDKKVFSEFDKLTGLFNRAYGDYLNLEHLKYHPEEAAAVILIKIKDIDRLMAEKRRKMAGTIIAHLAARLTDVFEKNCVISRTAIDEFTIFMKHGSVPMVEDAIEYLYEEELLAVNGEEKELYQVQTGYALYPEDSRDYMELNRMAEMALDVQKNGEAEKKAYRFDRSMVKKENSRKALNMTEIAKYLPGAFLVMQVDDHRKLLFANQEMADLFECEDYEELFQKCEGNYNGLVYYEDYDTVAREISEQLEELQIGGRFLIKHRITTKTGVIKAVEADCRMVESDYYGNVLYFFLRET